MRFAFLAGLPRSGSTLLAALLNQHPDVYVSNTSPVCSMMWETQNAIQTSQQYQATPQPDNMHRAMSALMPAWYADRTETVVADKCRQWGTPANLAMLRTYVTEQPAIVCTVRPTLDILASLITLMNANPPGSVYDRNLPQSFRPLNDVRCDALMAAGGDLDMAMWSVHNLTQPDNNEAALFVEYAELVGDTRQVLADVEQHWQIDPYRYDLDCITVVRPEDDWVYGLHGMHKVGRSIAPSVVKPENVLSEYVLHKYGPTTPTP